jgi:Reverse transcriptase (RNA-dependent DNA polymerase).
MKLDSSSPKWTNVYSIEFYRGRVLYVLYTDNSILAGPDNIEINKVDTGLNITIKGDLQGFLGINIQRDNDGLINLTQLHLINQILKDLQLTDNNVKLKDVPAKSSEILTAGLNTKEFDKSFNYRSLIGKLNYLE